MSAKNLALVIPGLLYCEPGDRHQMVKDLKRSTVGRLLSRAEHETILDNRLEQLLFQLFDYQVSDDQDLPIAAICHLADTKKRTNDYYTDKYYIRADPVSLHPDRDSVVMLNNQVLDISIAEAEQIANEINNHFSEDGWELETPTSHRWYLALKEKPELNTSLLADVIGKNIHDYLPSGKDSQNWRRLMNEIQMLLSASKVNQAREADGKLPINSLWFWGGGYLPKAAKSPWSLVWSNHAFTRGLARLGGSDCFDCPINADDWLAQIKGDGNYLLVIDPMFNTDKIIELDNKWFSAIVSAIKSRDIDSITVYLVNGTKYHLTSRLMRRWWRRKIIGLDKKKH